MGRARGEHPPVKRKFGMDMTHHSGGTVNGVLTLGHNTVLSPAPGRGDTKTPASALTAVSEPTKTGPAR
ncbi:hypothetical protein GCM10010398_74480 [Streptomyces fimbriatus]